jgi:hypothetical protein
MSTIHTRDVCGTLLTRIGCIIGNDGESLDLCSEHLSQNRNQSRFGRAD